MVIRIYGSENNVATVRTYRSANNRIGYSHLQKPHGCHVMLIGNNQRVGSADGRMQGVKFFGWISLITFVPSAWNDQIWQDNTWGRGVFLSATPQLQGDGVPALHNFGGSLLFMYTFFDAELSNMMW